MSTDIAQRLRIGIEAGAIDLADIMDAADEIERLRRERETDGRQMSAMLEDWQSMQYRCVNPAADAKPVAFGVWGGGYGYVTLFRESADEAARIEGGVVIPLYCQPQPALTDAEREALEWSALRSDADAQLVAAQFHAAGGPGHHISKAEIDALQHVVEDGRIVKMQDYGALRSLLVRLRPEWEDEEDSDRSQPINDERLAALEELSALDQKLELEYGLTGNPLIKARHSKAAKTDPTQPRNGTPADGSVQADGSVPDSKTQNEPVASLDRHRTDKAASRPQRGGALKGVGNVDFV